MRATLIKSLQTRSLPPYICVEFEVEGLDATSSSTELISVPLLNDCSRIDLKVISVSCSSPDFDFIVLDKNDISALRTINEVLKYTNASYTFTDNDFNNYLIFNRDVTETNRLYAYINNHSIQATGTITIKLIYIAMAP